MGLNDRRRKYNIQRSTYTTRKIHKKLDNDLVIYEHDRLITYSGSTTSGSPTFPMLYTDTRYGKQAHNVGEWEVIKVNGETKTCYTGEYLKDYPSNPENTVKLRVKHKSLLNFAYFGSCADLVESSLENIITLFGGKTIEEIEILKKDANLSEFEEYMLNTASDPIYTMVLENVYESSIGVSVEEEEFEFPKETDEETGKTYLDIEGPFFERYYNRLMDIAEFLDTRQSNVMWRVMTHDAIKNMDFTFVKNDDDIDDYGKGATKMNNIINAIGRQMDVLKMYIDNIKHTNNLSYDNFSSMPDYILSDKLEMAGWEVYSVAPNPNDSESNKINVKFMENLLINSKNILTRKGTRHGIDMLLSLFGLTSYENNKESYDYKIDEHVYVVDGFNDGGNLITEAIDNNISLNVEKFNYWKTAFEDNPEGETDTLQGLPLSIVINEEKKYIIPWFDRLSKMDGDPYFEMNGGWFHLPRKKVINRVISINGSDVVLENDDEKLPIYNESINRINIIDNLDSLVTYGSYSQWVKVKNAICYVTDITDFNFKYDTSLKDSNNRYLEGWSDDKKIGFGENLKRPSHYFMLKNINNSSTVGNKVTSYEEGENNTQIIKTTECGWVNIPEEEFNDGTLSDDAKLVLYVESIEDNHKGNKPHRGDKFDDGSSYRDIFERIFGYSIDTDKYYSHTFMDVAYNCDDNSLKEGIGLCGFNLDTQVDNVKTHYFTDMMYNENYYTETENTFYESTLSPHNFENKTNKWGEASDYSVVNSKQMVITFNKEFIDNDDAYDYLIKSILPYLEQVIPSTTIVKIASSN